MAVSARIQAWTRAASSQTLAYCEMQRPTPTPKHAEEGVEKPLYIAKVYGLAKNVLRACIHASKASY